MERARAVQRQEAIVHLLSRLETLSVDRLAESLDVSVWTIRRDLGVLEKKGVVSRLHGGATLVPTVAEAAGVIDSFGGGDQNMAAKARIGRAAAALVHPSAHIAVAGGTTTLEVARALVERGFQGEVVTNALDIAIEMAQSQTLRVVCTGGDVQGRYRTLVGPVAERALRLHYFDVAIIGVSGVSAREGITVNSQVEATLLELMIEHAQSVILVADSSKMGRTAFASLLLQTPVQALVTDRAIPTVLDAELRRNKIPVVIA